MIGGGDWSADRLLPDLVGGFLARAPVNIRNPYSIRPWQHVLEPLRGYLQLAQKLLTGDPRYATAYNFGPREDDARTVQWIVEHMTSLWSDGTHGLSIQIPHHEARFLRLDTSRARHDLDWIPTLRLNDALNYLVQWYKCWAAGADMHAFTLDQIDRYAGNLSSPTL